MRYQEDDYEDELDRMRARQQRKKNGMPRRGHRDEFEIEDLDDETFDEPFDDEFFDDDAFDDDPFENGRFEDTSVDDRIYDDSMDTVRPRTRRTKAGIAPAPVPTSARKAKAAPNRTKKPKRKKKKLLPVLFLAIVLFAGYLLFQWVRDDSYWTIAVFGVDSRDGNLGKGALSDVEMICNINKKTGEIRLVSVFRDSYLRINQSDDYDKINEAYFKGGHKQAVDALRDNLDLPIDDYATFNWKAVVDAINVLGGVDLEISDKEFAYINSFITETVQSTGVGSYQLEHSGMNHLDGVQAVAYARLRLMDTDFNRTERQRKVLGQAMEKAKQADNATLKRLVAAVYPQVSTSVGVSDLLGMAKNARKYYIGQTSGFPFSHQEIKIQKKSCVIPTTLESNVVQLHSFLYEKENYIPSATVKKISNHIAEVSGLGIPGSDTESGKNIGTEGNNGGGQNAPQNPTPKPQQTEAPVPAETESLPEETETESSAAETESTEVTVVEPLESETATTGASESPNGPSGGPGVSTTKPVPETSGSVVEAPSPSQHATTEAPSETKGALEAPGQGNASAAEEQGPGVTP
ncbi:MAG: LCP family protein [Lachnospiraceae bacterium]|nr:LCP family protein [Lachnospiraceae bacterium]